MTDKINPVPSPCISQCQMDASTGLCKGCWRTINEIIAWGTLDDTGRQQVWTHIELRKAEVVFSTSPP
jgi:uncharacterized protein